MVRLPHPLRRPACLLRPQEKHKIISTQQKETKIKVQREQQLRELAALRKRDEQEQQKYDQGILRSIHQEIMMEKAKEKMKRESDALNLQMVADQNSLHREHCKQLKEKEIDDARKLEAQWTGLLDKQERQRSRQLKQTYARQALQYKASSTMQQIQDQQSAEDEARADGHAAEKERQAAAREQAQKDERARLQQETLEVLAIQVREKASRAQADAQRESMVGERERMELERAEKAASKRRSMTKTRYSDYAQELAQQMAVQEERKVLEPYLMSKAERQMNAALLRKLPGGVEF